MKKLLTLVLCLVLGASALTGCAGKGEPYEKKTYTSGDTHISELVLDVRDRAVEVTASEDDRIHIVYSENSKEYYELSVTGSVLTLTAASSKEWTDYVGEKAPAEVRKVSVQVPDGLLDTLKISTTNENISLAPLTLTGDVFLKANGGDIAIDSLAAGKNITLDVKNGNISGVISGSYDDYAISCAVKKGKSNLPTDKESGSKHLTVTANNGDVSVEIR